MGGIKYDSKKPKMGLIPSEALVEIAKVLTYGADKYSANNWRKGFVWSRVYDALQRHAAAWNAGEDVDSETDLSHMAHLACCALFLLTFIVTGTGTDDRYKGENK